MTTIDIATIPTNERLRREWIKYQLRALGSSLSQVAREEHVSRCATGKALRWPYPRQERAIAKRLGLRPEQIWPERYDENGNSNRPMGRTKKPDDKSTTGSGRRNISARAAT